MGRKNKTAVERQEQIYKYIKGYIARHGYPPSVREISVAIGLKSASTVHGYLRKLEERGLRHFRRRQQTLGTGEEESSLCRR